MSDPTPAAPAAPAKAATIPAAAPDVPPPARIVVEDHTQKTGLVHRVVIPKSLQPQVLALIDPQAPAGKAATGVSAGVGAQGELVIRISYEA